MIVLSGTPVRGAQEVETGPRTARPRARWPPKIGSAAMLGLSGSGPQVRRLAG
jgi:hypothetical protein